LVSAAGIAIVHSNAPGRYISTYPPPPEGAARLLLAAAALRLLALALAGTSLLAPAALDRLTAPAFADDGGNGNHGGNGNGGNGNYGMVGATTAARAWQRNRQRQWEWDGGGTNADREGRGGFETGEIVVLGDGVQESGRRRAGVRRHAQGGAAGVTIT
jgi:hypothetical protein